MGRKKTSGIWLIDKEELQNTLDSSDSIVDVLRKLGFDPYNGNHKTLHARVAADGLSTKKLDVNNRIRAREHLSNIRGFLDDKEVFCENSSYSRYNLKQRLLTYLEYRCECCGIGGEYNGKPLSLQIDHKNGVNNDNRIENLRFLCPNCHSQTETFSGKRHKRTKLYESSEHREERIKKTRKFDPSREELEKLVTELPMTKIGKFFGVSDTAVKNRCILLNIKWK